MHEHDSWHMGGMWIWWLVIFVVIVAGLWVAFSYARRGNRRGAAESPEQTLKRRFANGEIDQKEYEDRLSELRK